MSPCTLHPFDAPPWRSGPLEDLALSTDRLPPNCKDFCPSVTGRRLRSPAWLRSATSSRLSARAEGVAYRMLRLTQALDGPRTSVACSNGLLVLDSRADDGLESGFGMVVAVEKQRLTASPPRDAVVGAPEGDQFDRVLVLQEHLENIGVLLGLAL